MSTGALWDTRNKGVTRRDVAAAGAAVLARAGIERLSMRQVAGELGVTAMALYNHVADKDDLLELVAAHLREQIVVDEDLPPREQLLSLLVQLRDLGAQHPRLLENPLALVGGTHEALQLPIRLLRLLAALGLDPAQVRATYNTLTFLVTGAASVQRVVADARGLEANRKRERALLDAAPERDVALVRAMVDLPRTSLEEQFALAVDVALRGQGSARITP